MLSPQDWSVGSVSWLQQIAGDCKTQRIQVSSFDYQIEDASENSLMRQLETHGRVLLAELKQLSDEQSVRPPFDTQEQTTVDCIRSNRLQSSSFATASVDSYFKRWFQATIQLLLADSFRFSV